MAHWSRDGRFLTIQQYDPSERRFLMYYLDVQSSRGELKRIVQSRFELESDADISANGRWTAYGGLRGDTIGLYVQPFPPDGREWPLAASTDFFEWSRQGQTLVFSDGPRLLEFANWRPNVVQSPTVLFQAGFTIGAFWTSADSSRYLIAVPLESPITAHLNLLVNWQERLTGTRPGEAQ